MVKDPSLYKRDPLIDIVGPMTRARSKQVSGALNNLIVDCLIKAQKKMDSEEEEKAQKEFQWITRLSIQDGPNREEPI